VIYVLMMMRCLLNRKKNESGWMVVFFELFFWWCKLVIGDTKGVVVDFGGFARMGSFFARCVVDVNVGRTLEFDDNGLFVQRNVVSRIKSYS